MGAGRLHASPSRPGEHVALVGTTGEGKSHLRATAEPHVGRAARSRARGRRRRARVGSRSATPSRRGHLPGPGSVHGHDRGQPRARRRRRGVAASSSARCRPPTRRRSWHALPGGLGAPLVRARRQSLARRASALGHRASARVQSRNPRAGRGDVERRSRVRADDPGGDGAAHGRTNDASRSRTGCRPSTTADRILVLHRGRIHEEGTHADLLRQRRTLRAAVRAAAPAPRCAVTFRRRGLPLVRRIPPGAGRDVRAGRRAGSAGRASARAVGGAMRTLSGRRAVAPRGERAGRHQPAPRR